MTTLDTHPPSKSDDALVARLAAMQAKIGAMGLGYVGLPLTLGCAEAGYETLGFDTDVEKIAALTRGESYFTTMRQSDWQRPFPVRVGAA